MAIFSNSDNTSGSAGGSTTIITDGAALTGELTLGCDLFVDGAFEGIIRSEKMVTVGKHGRIKGEIFAQGVLVQGLVEGTVDAAHVEIKASGKVRGTISSDELAIEPKGRFEGESRLRSAVEAHLLEG